MGYRCPNCKEDFGSNAGSEDALNYHFAYSSRCEREAMWIWAIRRYAIGTPKELEEFEATRKVNKHESILNHLAILKREMEALKL